MKPRVLVLTTYYAPVIGGVETHARQLVTALHDDGFPVHVITKRVSRAHASRELVDDVLVHRVGPVGERRASGKWLAIPGMLLKILWLRSAADILVCIDFRGIGVAAVAAGTLLRIPVIAQAGTAGVLAGPVDPSASGLPAETRWQEWLKAPARAVYRRADHFVCIARDIEREATQSGVRHDHVHYLPHGVDVNRFRPAEDAATRDAIRATLGWPTDRPVVLYVGRLSVEKGLLDLIEAWRLLSHPTALLVVVGPDMPSHPWDAGAKARALAVQYGLTGRVLFAGPTTDPSPMYRAADVCVQPSHFEAFGISAIEAMASGVPVVASRVGGLRDFLTDGQNALLHEPKSPAGLASVLGTALGDADLRARISTRALNTVRTQFDQRLLMTRYAQLIQQVARPA